MNKLLVSLLLGVSLLSGTSAALAADPSDEQEFLRAVEINRGDIVRDMIAKGVDPNFSEPYKGNPGLNLALFEDNMESFKALVNAPGINLNKRAKNGNDALMIAAWKNNEEAVQTLLSRGAKVNHDGWTALHYAASTGNMDIVTMLINKGAWVNARSPNGTTPLMMAARSGHTDICKMLLSHGADPRMINEQNYSALTFAHEEGFGALEHYLEKRLKYVMYVE